MMMIARGNAQLQMDRSTKLEDRCCVLQFYWAPEFALPKAVFRPSGGLPRLSTTRKITPLRAAND